MQHAPAPDMDRPISGGRDRRRRRNTTRFGIVPGIVTVLVDVDDTGATLDADLPGVRIGPDQRELSGSSPSPRRTTVWLPTSYGAGRWFGSHRR